MHSTVIAAPAALGGLLSGYDADVISGALLFQRTASPLSPLRLGVVTSIALGAAAFRPHSQEGSLIRPAVARFYCSRRSSSLALNRRPANGLASPFLSLFSKEPIDAASHLKTDWLHHQGN